MKHYKELRNCRLCKKRFVLDKEKPSGYYCPECFIKYKAMQKKEHDEEAQKAADEAKEKEE
jgi:uncharacterized Zn ribbon protein